ncbi:MAG: hypothetical protein IJV85_05340 [Clostridia bacterium]|nr:hypothetical protein [Clostridia bacterium]
MLVLLYYLSQNPNFSESVKPLMEKLKNSEEMLRFLGDLSKFTDTFGSFKGSGNSSGEKPPHKEPPNDKKSEKASTSPTAGIADEFIQSILDSYFKKRN